MRTMKNARSKTPQPRIKYIKTIYVEGQHIKVYSRVKCDNNIIPLVVHEGDE